MTKIRILAIWWIKYFMSVWLLLCAIAGNLYFDTHCHSLQFGYTFRRGPVHKISLLEYWGYHNNDQNVSLIPKRDPGITNLSIPGLRIQFRDCNHYSHYLHKIAEIFIPRFKTHRHMSNYSCKKFPIRPIGSPQYIRNRRLNRQLVP